MQECYKEPNNDRFRITDWSRKKLNTVNVLLHTFAVEFLIIIVCEMDGSRRHFFSPNILQKIQHTV